MTSGYRTIGASGYRIIGVSRYRNVAAVAAAVVVLAGSALAQRFGESDLWLTPSGGSLPALGAAVSALEAGDAGTALPVFTQASSDPVVGSYARLYRGRAELELERPDAAAASARQVINTSPGGYLGEAALWLLADASETAHEWRDAVRALQALTGLKSTNPAEAHLRLGRAALKLNDLLLAESSFSKVYYEFPLSTQAEDAATELKRFVAPRGAELLAKGKVRAEQLYAGRRFSDARRAFEQIRPVATGEDRALVDLRLAECDLGLRRFAAARDSLRAYLATSTFRRLEAEYQVLNALKGLGLREAYVDAAWKFADANPTSAFAETALNDLGTYYILANEDAKAAETFTEQYKRYPSGTFADRAAWKAGWWAYRTGNDEEVLRLFESAAVTFPRADYRPSWLYWSARANERLGRLDAALTGFERTITFYRNSYYGRLAMRDAGELRSRVRRPAVTLAASAKRDLPLTIVAGTPPPNAPLIQALLKAELYDAAVAELRKVQTESGTSPYLEATIGYALNRKGDLRPGITAMRRAYPQFMAEGGELLPTAILRVIFPLDYWDLLRRYAGARSLDPYLVAALVAQESTFQADVRSSANAWGLMQIIPPTGQMMARKLGIPRFTTSRLTDPEINVRIGTSYFADLLDEYGSVPVALAAYNAGPVVARWVADRPGIDPDEFVDDIPYPETQNYVKRIVGTAEDYRILYGP